jgi:hypothetical protein
VFKEGAWRSLDPVDQGMVLGVLAGAVLALLMRRLTWIALGVAFGIAIGYLIDRRQERHGSDEQTLNSDPLPDKNPYEEETPEDRLERLRGGVDEELSAALKAHREAWRQYREDPARKAGGQAPTGDERFLAEFGAERGQHYIAVSRALNKEARSVPDPGGPLLGDYNDALEAWADSHPEIDRAELNVIINRLLWEHR